MKEKVSTFSDRYNFGGFEKIVPHNSVQARDLSAQTKKKIRLLKSDLSKKPLVDPLTRQPVPAVEYLEWRRRARAEIRDGETYLKTIADYCRRAKKGRAVRPALY